MPSHFSRVWFFATPWTVACQTALSVGFSRQEYWSGVSCSPPGGLPDPGIEPGSPTLQVDSLLSEPPGKPMNTGVGWHAFFQGIFRIQGLNPGLPHCRQILYPLSHQGSPSGYTDLYVILWRRATHTHLLSVSSLVLRMAPHSSTLAWKIPWMEEPGRLQSMGLRRVGHDRVTSLSLFTFMHWRRKWQPTPVFLPGESQGRGSLMDCCLQGHTESDTTEVT